MTMKHFTKENIKVTAMQLYCIIFMSSLAIHLAWEQLLPSIGQFVATSDYILMFFFSLAAQRS